MIRQKGFTLIEMLVAMAIFTSLISVLMLGFQQGLLLWDKTQQQSHRWLKSEFRYGLLSTVFSQAILADNQYKKGLYASYFIGTSTNIKLISAAPIMDANGRVRPIEIKAVKENKRWKLLYREGARYSDIDRAISWSNNWVELLTELEEITFSYLAPAFPIPAELKMRWLNKEEKLRYREKPTWVAGYDSKKLWLYPLQISIDFTDGKGVAQQWLFTPPNSPAAWSMEIYEDN
jgi:prepilin-type N-terminal cleavage/methylation domain-containing protein